MAAKMFRFADVPLSLSGMTRIAGRRVFLRAPSMDDWAEWAELRARSDWSNSRLLNAVGAPVCRYGP